MAKQDIELIYFNGPGRGELARLCLHAGGVEFKDNRVSMEDWGAIKMDPTSGPGSLFKTVPALRVGGEWIGQSRAVSFAAAEIGLKSNELTMMQRAKDQMFLSAHADIQGCMYKCLFGSDESKAAGKEALTASVTPTLTTLENQLPDSGFLHGGDKVSLGDLSLYNLVASFFPGLKALGFNMEPFPKATALTEKVQNLESLQGYFKFMAAALAAAQKK